MSTWEKYGSCVAAARKAGCDEEDARNIALEVCAQDHASPTTMTFWRALDHLRLKKMEIVRGFPIDEIIDEAPGPEALLEAKQDLKRLLGRLSEAEAYVLMKGDDGYDDAEVGLFLGKTQTNVRQLRSRARRKLLNGN